MKTLLFIFERYFLAASSIAITFIIAAILTPEEYGQLSYALAISGFLSIFTLQSLDQILQREIVIKPDKQDSYIYTLLIIKLSLITVCSLVYWIGVSISELEQKSMFIVVSVNNFFICLDVFRTAYIVKNDALSLFKATVFPIIISFLVKVVLIYKASNVEYIALCYLLDFLFIGISFLIRFFPKKRRIEFDKDFVYVLFNEGKYLFLSACFLMAFVTADQIIVASKLGMVELATYSICMKVVSLFIMVSTVFNLSFVHRLNYNESNFFAVCKSMLIFSLGFGIFTAFICALIIPPIFSIFFGNKYPLVPDYLPYFSVIIFFAFIQSSTGRILVSANYGKDVLYRNIFAAIISITSAFFLVDYFNILGIVFSVGLGYFLSGVAYCFISRRLRNLFARSILKVV